MVNWQELERDFRELAQRAPELRADRQWSEDYDRFTITGPGEPVLRERLRALAAVAGSGVRVAHSDLLPEDGPPLPDDLQVWGRAVWELVGPAETPLVGSLTLEGKPAGHVFIGRIDRFAEASGVAALRLRHRARAVSAPQPEPAARDGDPFVDSARLEELRGLTKAKYDVTRLIRLCEELNVCFRNECYHASVMLTRAILDHVPPILGCKSFAEVTSSYAGGRSFKESMETLDKMARKIADSHLHTQIRPSEVLPTRVQVNFSHSMDVLLGEVVRVLRAAT
jgi:hypothetical protein